MYQTTERIEACVSQAGKAEPSPQNQSRGQSESGWGDGACRALLICGAPASKDQFRRNKTSGPTLWKAQRGSAWQRIGSGRQRATREVVIGLPAGMKALHTVKRRPAGAALRVGKLGGKVFGPSALYPERMLRGPSP